MPPMTKSLALVTCHFSALLDEVLVNALQLSRME